VLFFHVPSRAISVKGFTTNGCTHQMPLFANSTTRWSDRAPVTRPAIDTTCCWPPSAASGTSVKVIDGVPPPAPPAQPTTITQTVSATTARQMVRFDGYELMKPLISHCTSSRDERTYHASGRNEAPFHVMRDLGRRRQNSHFSVLEGARHGRDNTR